MTGQNGANWRPIRKRVLHSGRRIQLFGYSEQFNLVLRKDGRLLGVECKRTDAPRLTPSLRIALEDLQLERIAVVYPGSKRFSIASAVEAVPLHEVWQGGMFVGGAN